MSSVRKKKSPKIKFTQRQIFDKFLFPLSSARHRAEDLAKNPALFPLPLSVTKKIQPFGNPGQPPNEVTAIALALSEIIVSAQSRGLHIFDYAIRVKRPPAIQPEVDIEAVAVPYMFIGEAYGVEYSKGSKLEA